MRKIRTFVNKLSKEFATYVPEKAQQYMSKMEAAAERIHKMIDSILLYSSLNTIGESMEDVNLNDVIAGIITDLEILIEEKGALIEVEILPRICGAPVLLHQLFYKLINNLLKFSKEGEIPRIEIACTIVNNEQGEQVATITVNDNGIGFRQSDAESIFMPFSRLNHKEKYEGTVLVLPYVKRSWKDITVPLWQKAAKTLDRPSR